MSRFERIWNGRPGGVFSALIIAFASMWGRVADRISTFLWCGNLRELGRGSVIQRRVTIRVPGRVSIGSMCSIGMASSLTSEHIDGDLLVKNNVIINPKVHLDFSGGLVVGDNSVISEGVTIFTHSHGYDPRSPSLKTPLCIGDNVWVGANVTICEGVGVIASRSIIAAGAVVTRALDRPGLYGGVPARLIRDDISTMMN